METAWVAQCPRHQQLPEAGKAVVYALAVWGQCGARTVLNAVQGSSSSNAEM